MTEEKTFLQLMDLLKMDDTEDRHFAVEKLSYSEWGNLVNMAVQQAVSSLLFYQLKAKDLLPLVPAEMRETMRMNYRANTFTNMRYFKTLLVIANAFSSAGISMIVLKGAYLAKTIYPNIGLRKLGDLDLLVQKKDLFDAVSIILDLGYQPVIPFSLDREPLYKELPHFIKDDSPILDLHWSIDHNRGLSVDVNELWNKAKLFPLEELNLLCLKPNDLLVHLCIHIAYSHNFEFTLRPYCDIQHLIAHFSTSLDWTSVVAKSRLWGAEKGVYLSLRFAFEHLEAEVPEEVLDQLSEGENADPTYRLIRPQILSVYGKPKLTPDLARLSTASSLDKIDILYKRFFPARIEMAYLYNVPPNSLSVYLKYPVRWLYLIRTYRTLVGSVSGGNKDLTAITARKAKIMEWLAEDMK